MPTTAELAELGTILARFDRELSEEVQAVVERWADQTAHNEVDGSVNPRGLRSASDYRDLAAVLERTRD
jgi:hypothetical protein